MGILEGIFVAHNMHDAAGLVARFAAGGSMPVLAGDVVWWLRADRSFP
ncbi:MAG: hypothetical protein M3076_05005 [Actinomycetota bacterium]|nr:hypothetical protein [Actinomycetota bacterium]